MAELRSFVRWLGRGVHDRGWRELQEAPLLFGCSPKQTPVKRLLAQARTHEMQ